jgi:hypothetical protein
LAGTIVPVRGGAAGQRHTACGDMTEKTSKQLLHLVFGGELQSLEGVDFRDVSKLDVVGIFPNYKSAYDAWKDAAQRTVDNALMRYYIVHMHRLLDPSDD